MLRLEKQIYPWQPSRGEIERGCKVVGGHAISGRRSPLPQHLGVAPPMSSGAGPYQGLISTLVEPPESLR